jgi:hypothetical protein
MRSLVGDPARCALAAAGTARMAAQPTSPTPADPSPDCWPRRPRRDVRDARVARPSAVAGPVDTEMASCGRGRRTQSDRMDVARPVAHRRSARRLSNDLRELQQKVAAIETAIGDIHRGQRELSNRQLDEFDRVRSRGCGDRRPDGTGGLAAGRVRSQP